MEQGADYYNVEGLTGKKLLAIMMAIKPTDFVNTLGPYRPNGEVAGFIYKINKGARVTFSILRDEPQITIRGTSEERELAARTLPKILGHNHRLTKLTLEQNVP